MSGTITINHWQNMISDKLDDPIKFTKVMQDLQHVALEDAIRSLGISDREYLCIKELAVPVQINLSRSIRSLARDWSSAFKIQLQRRWQAGDGSIIHYPDLHYAHLQCAKGVLTGQIDDLWAWQQCDLLPTELTSNQPKTVFDQWCYQSAHRKHYQISLWTYLLGSPLLGKAISQFTPTHWQQQIAGLEQVSGRSFNTVFSVVNQCFAEFIKKIPQGIYSNINELSDIYHNLLYSGFGLRVEQKTLVNLVQDSPSLITNVILIACVVKEPGLVRLAKPTLEKRINHLILSNTIHRIDALNNDRQSDSESEQQFIGTELGDSVATDQRQSETRLDHQEDITKTALDSVYVNEQRRFRKEQLNAQIDENLRDVFEVDSTEDLSPTDSTQELSVLTQFAGIFWLYNLFLKTPDKLEQFLSGSVLYTRSQQWVWLWLCYSLLSQSDEINNQDQDFRVLAPLFAGLGIESTDDEIFEQIPSSAEFVLLSDFAESIKTDFVNRVLPEEVEGKASFREMIRRRARVTCCGPWMDVEYSLQDVDINVRRLGLDANPDFVPWLGMVVRFHYA